MEFPGNQPYGRALSERVASSVLSYKELSLNPLCYLRAMVGLLVSRGQRIPKVKVNIESEINLAG